MDKLSLIAERYGSGQATQKELLAELGMGSRTFQQAAQKLGLERRDVSAAHLVHLVQRFGSLDAAWDFARGLEAAGWTRKSIAAELGISVTTLRRVLGRQWEQGGATEARGQSVSG